MHAVCPTCNCPLTVPEQVDVFSQVASKDLNVRRDPHVILLSRKFVVIAGVIIVLIAAVLLYGLKIFSRRHDTPIPAPPKADVASASIKTPQRNLATNESSAKHSATPASSIMPKPGGVDAQTGSPTNKATTRKFTDKTTNQTFAATLVEFRDGNAILQKVDQTQTVLAIDHLSEPDRLYVMLTDIAKIDEKLPGESLSVGQAANIMLALIASQIPEEMPEVFRTVDELELPIRSNVLSKSKIIEKYGKPTLTGEDYIRYDILTLVVAADDKIIGFLASPTSILKQNLRR
jgi:hypothetical protein